MMKTFIFLSLCLFFSYFAYGQAPSDETFNAAAPRGAEKLTKERFRSIVHRDYKRSVISENHENIYQLDGLLISYWGLSVKPDYDKSLEASQAEMLEILKISPPKNIVDFSKIIVVNNIKFLVYQYHNEYDEFFLRFQSNFNKDHKNINGLIQFKKPDEEKAHAALQNLLRTIHFRD